MYICISLIAREIANIKMTLSLHPQASSLLLFPSLSFLSSIPRVYHNHTHTQPTPSMLVLFYMSAQNSANNEEQANKIKNNICMYTLYAYMSVYCTQKTDLRKQHTCRVAVEGWRGGGGGFKNCRQTN